MKRRILCFGDSNTYGYDFETGRFDDETRWTRRLGAMLGDGYAVIEEGLNGRTFIHDDPTEGGHKNGMKYLPPCLMSHNPLDLVVIMLGTNDTKERFGMNACTIAQCAQQMVLLAKQYALGRDGKPSRVLDEGRFSELLAAFWPELPRARVRPGATWTGRWQSAVASGLLKETPIQLQHRLRYTLVDIRREADLEVARIQVAGNIVPAAAGQVPPGTVVTGTGRVEGTTLVDLATGRTVLADDRTAWSVVVRLEGQNIEVVHFSDRKSRIWRPRLVPDGQAGFEAPLPLPDGGVPGGTGAPAQASPVPGASPKP